jgi:hypothetical protein
MQTQEDYMYTYRCLVRMNPISQYITIQAANDAACKQLIEGMYGRGSALSYVRI